MATKSYDPFMGVRGGMRRAQQFDSSQRAMDDQHEESIINTATKRQALSEAVNSLPTRTKSDLLKVMKLEDEVELTDFENKNKEKMHYLEVQKKLQEAEGKDIQNSQDAFDLQLDKDLKRRERLADINATQAKTSKDQSEGSLFDSQGAALTKTNTNNVQQQNRKTELAVNQLERTLELVEANPNAIGWVAELKSKSYSIAKMASDIFPENQGIDTALSAVAEGLDVGDVEVVRANLEAATSALLPIANGGDPRSTDFDVKRASRLNIAIQRITTPEQAVPVLKDMIQIMKNTATVGNMLNKTRLGTVTELKQRGLMTQIQGVVHEAPIVDGVYVPFMEVPDADTPEVRQMLKDAPVGAKFIVMDGEGNKVIRTKQRQRTTD